ncbi:Activator of stress genes 1 [Penicillium ucsense]|uniref:Activator of stress genes 1 n=1 Tax=Penicillium ucsense TaxID=2839758 RepID=A0A8J8W4P4_9EURO|nr:Activator of stress genes 1 [Penicillium ucsense]KAF7738986.1 Activator of stress genes 1 [Penicillium ucsense]
MAASGAGAHGDSDDEHMPPNWSNDSVESSPFASNPHAIAKDASPTDNGVTSQPLPLQKRRRVGRACDECRRKKIKCDGKQPCTHCTVYSYECSYDQPSNRRRNPAPQYVEALEARMQKAEALLRTVLPDVNLDDPNLDVNAPEISSPIHQRGKKQAPAAVGDASQPQGGTADNAPEAGDDSLLETMVGNTGCLDRDDQGHWDYHGQTSGIIFVRRLRKQLGALEAPVPRKVSAMLESPRSVSVSDSPQDAALPPTHDLPPKPIAIRLCRNALDDGCALMRFVIEHRFFASLDRIYDTPPEQFGNEENSFLPLLYIVMAVGCLFSDDGAGTLDLAGYEGAIGQGFQFFKAGRQLLDITDCRDLTALQAICFMVLFLQSSAKLSTCYSYIGIALRSALRLGLHRTVAADFNPMERELRKRIFWVIRKMDVYVSTMLGLPMMLNDDDIDQEYPLDVDGEFITPEGILQMPTDYTPLMAGCNAHTRLCNVVLKVVKYIYPVKNVGRKSKSDQRYMVSHSKIREIERDLQNWMEELPPALRPGTEVSPQLERVRQMLRIGYAHVQMVMYRPFLHYVSGGSQARGVDKRSYACAAACVSVSRNIVHITTGMHKRGLLNGSFWFTMYTTYFAILSLVFFVIENPDSPTAKDGVLKDAMEGKNTLAGLAKKSMAADRCSQSLTCLFKTLPERLKNRQPSKTAAVNLKRRVPSTFTSEPEPMQEVPAQALPLRSNTFPLHMMTPAPAGGPALNRRQKSLDNTQSQSYPNNNTENGSQSAWLASTPELFTETMSTPEPTPTNSYGAPFSNNQEPSNLAWAQQFNNPSNLPDLMPMMFPSDDPFAYPTQPMSTLEADHFQHEPDSTQMAQSAQPAFDKAPRQQGIGSNTQIDPSGTGITTPTFDTFPQYPNFPVTSSHSIKTSIPGHLQQTPTQPMNPVRLQSPVSQSQTPREHLSSPDLVSIPNQNFVWQGYNFQPLNPETLEKEPTLGPMPQDSAPTNGIGNLSMGYDESPMGLNVDMNVSFDDLFGNNTSRPGAGTTNDEWSQWMSTGA